MTLNALQTSALLTLVVYAAAKILWALVRGRRARAQRRRLRGLFPEPAPRTRTARAGPPSWLGYGMAPLVAAGLGWALFGAIGGLCAGVLVAAGLRQGAAKRASAPADVEEATRHLPLAADLLAACAASGAGPGEAAEAVGRSLGGPLGERLTRTAAELRLGGEPAEVWRRFGAIPGASGLARCMERAGSSGAPAAEAVARHATALRAARARTAATRARRAQVLISAPVGLCFLPAFLAVGVAPVVIGLATGLLDG
ncbi:type II secretion system F family protein [Streptomyces sp. LMG1-1-1.1]|uniref:type II secretion system F family protein n=1 Tax=Streptomyces sp. LMG1-1-1.1 TaxID=3135245 RepID=UPI003465A1BF